MRVAATTAVAVLVSAAARMALARLMIVFVVVAAAPVVRLRLIMTGRHEANELQGIPSSLVLVSD